MFSSSSQEVLNMFPKSPNVFPKITFTYMVLHNFMLTHSRFGIYTYNMSKTIYSHSTANVSCSTFMLALFELWASNHATSAKYDCNLL